MREKMQSSIAMIVLTVILRDAEAWEEAITSATIPKKTSGNGPIGTRKTVLPTILI